MSLSTEDLLRGYELMLAARGFEESAERLFAGNQVRGSTHLGIGQEAVAVGARLGTRDGDWVCPTYRGHNYAIAWGVPLEAAFGELLGRETGMERGRAGSKHFGSRAHHVLPGNAIVAAQAPIACGPALQAKLDGLDTVTVVPFGDGATNQAAWHEALNLAAVWDLPVIFLCENNLYSEMTPISAMVRVADLADRADAYGMNAEIVDGMDVEAVAREVRRAADHARAGGGPTLLEAKTYRYCGHMPGDTEPYRTKDEIEQWRPRDPLLLTAERLRALGVDPAQTQARVAAALKAAEASALAAPLPDVADLALGTADFMETVR